MSGRTRRRGRKFKAGDGWIWLAEVSTLWELSLVVVLRGGYYCEGAQMLMGPGRTMRGIYGMGM